MAVTPTRTIGPLHLEDLDPHRFEDLIRQLLYDFKRWRQLEATGRSGGDEGFDARGWESLVDINAPSEDEEDEEDKKDQEQSEPVKERLWLIQCKREKAIGPKKLKQYVDDIPENERRNIYGVIFVAACEFSKKSRDNFREQCRAAGFAECYLWGKAEIEDMLFQPKNDHLLFAYFGISLRVRQRSLKTQVRSRLATKKKAKKFINDHQDIIIRDASDDRYPDLDADESKDRTERGRWRMFQSRGHHHNGLHLVIRKFYAFVDDDGEHWDYAENFNQCIRNKMNDPWDGREREDRSAAEETATSFWNQLPDKNKAWYEVFAILPYDNIIAIDEEGDECAPQTPHVYVTKAEAKNSPFLKDQFVELYTIGTYTRRYAHADPEKRVKKFPDSNE